MECCWSRGFDRLPGSEKWLCQELSSGSLDRQKRVADPVRLRDRLCILPNRHNCALMLEIYLHHPVAIADCPDDVRIRHGKTAATDKKVTPQAVDDGAFSAFGVASSIP